MLVWPGVEPLISHSGGNILCCVIIFQIKESLSIPVVANGDIKSECDVRNVHEVTGVNGNYLKIIGIYKLTYSGSLISRTSEGNENWFQKSGVRFTEQPLCISLVMFPHPHE